jgi:hypothetical protein
MADHLGDSVLDAALDYVIDNAENVYVCSAEPTTFLEASSTYKLGTKASPSFTGPADDAVHDGRKITLDAIADGVVDAGGNAGYIAITDDSASDLLAVRTLDVVRTISGETVWTLTSVDIYFSNLM